MLLRGRRRQISWGVGQRKNSIASFMKEYHKMIDNYSKDPSAFKSAVTDINSHFENLSPGYVRHRCLPHIAWRTGDKALRSSGLDYKAICAYLAEGVTCTGGQCLQGD